MTTIWQARADAGVAAAQFQLGYCFETGQGTLSDLVLSVKWYTRAAMQGHALAQYRQGLAYSNGIGVSWDLAEACKWFILAAQQKVTEAAAVLHSLKTSPEVRLAAEENARNFRAVLEPENHLPEERKSSTNGKPQPFETQLGLGF
jgi:TPR repeat protein